jgi:hypothetical protein
MANVSDQEPADGSRHCRSVRRVAQMPIQPAPFSREFGLMSETLVVETNNEELLAVAAAAFGRFDLPASSGLDVPRRPPLRLRILQHDGAATGARFRHHFDGPVYVVRGGDDVAVVDGPSGAAVAHVSAEAALDKRLVRYSFIEGPALAALIYGRGYVTAHACGIARGGLGLAVLGEEGAGKSTLALAAARHGLDVFAEDGVFLRCGPGGLEFWGMPWTQRLVMDALRFFPEIPDVQPIRQPNGEMKIEVDLDRWFPGRASPNAQPAGVVMLRRGSGRAQLSRTTGEEEIPVLWPWGKHWTPEHERATELLARLPVWRLESGDTPDEALAFLDELFDELSS